MKFKKRIPSKKYYTPEEVHYNLAGGIFGETLEYYVSISLCKIPLSLADRVIKECYFATIPRGVYGLYFTQHNVKNKGLILISDRHLRKGRPERIQHTVLHEIGHWYLKHDSPAIEHEERSEFKRKERETNKQVKKWLQEYGDSPPVTKLEANEWTRELWRVNGIEI